MQLQGKTILLTGAAGGVGRATALRLAKEGANLALADIRGDELRKIATQIGKTALPLEADVSRTQDVQRMVNETVGRFGCVDVLVNNAGGSANLLGKITTFIDSEESTWDFVFGLNLKGTFLCAHAVLGQMIQRRSGKIINIASIAGVCGLEERVDYSAAKAGVIGMTRALAMEVGRYNIQVNCISPGMINSWGISPPGKTYLGHGGDPAEVASLIAFLASEEADYITGQNYVIDGGRCLGPKEK